MIGLFEKKAAPEPIVTGTDVLRKTVAARNKSPHSLTALAREIEGLATVTLEAFAAGKADLSVEMLQKLTVVLYPHAEFDPETGMLRSANKAEPASYNHPPRFDPKSHPFYQPPHDPNRPRLAVPPAKLEKPKGPEPGWIGGFFSSEP